MTQMILGIDISKWQVFRDYRKVVEAGVAYAIIKDSQDVYQDPLFYVHMDGLEKAGLKAIGGYHYLVPCDMTIAIRGFLKRCLPLPIIPTLDVEDKSLTRADVANAIKVWTMETDVPGIVYTRANIWDKIGVPLPPGWVLFLASYPRDRLGRGPLTKLSAWDAILTKVSAWLAKYRLVLPNAFDKAHFWQFDDRADGPSFGTDPYKSKSIDLNVFFGTYEELLGLKTGEVVVENKPALFTAKAKSNLNVRNAPAGKVVRSFKSGDEFQVLNLTYAKLNFIQYLWGELEGGNWVALGRDESMSFVSVLESPIYVVAYAVHVGDEVFGGTAEVEAASEEELTEIVAVEAAQKHLAQTGQRCDKVMIHAVHGPFKAI